MGTIKKTASAEMFSAFYEAKCVPIILLLLLILL